LGFSSTPLYLWIFSFFDGKCILFFIWLWITLIEIHSTLLPNIYLYFPLMVSCPPYLGWLDWAPRY
jgi:hypothetical protein